ncbi:mitogen-activated protein kinase kinase kinase [Vitis vinifera]|uniref:mitogen-activated protein kinase kinase kinase n=1 Tax=Vitis vinifera TaxID=29760 RepID=A0PGA1_VITVI|nr:mitogen-activated protein kinase kinase kinase [Vitis vinifera]AAS19278.1 mitogen-activated protein kinase kinase kinase [Vitis vinifera]|eukprot:NP_001268205.1 mitogen-activated protein kinase kinase kinase [Vitis vinifera]
MQDIFGSVRRSLVFRPASGEDGEYGGYGGPAEKIWFSIRKSGIGLFSRQSVRALPPIPKDEAPSTRWRKGELIGCGAFGRVYMGMNLDSGELLAIRQVSIAANSASKEKTQAHIRELEEEVKLLKNLSHPNIVRYLGTAREDESLNILLEFVPGGSISSLLGKFGSFPESVIRMYTKQLLLGLEYLHKNGIMHRDIKGANILVDNKGCIKLADFGASKKVVELATMTGAKSMKGTPYRMAPEVILQTGHSFSADIWSVGCTVIEMATGKPPWSQQYQEVAALFHIGTTKSHPPIPEHLTAEAKDFLLKCLQKEPNLRPAASELLQHPFVSGEYQEPHPVFQTSVMENSGNMMATSETDLKSFPNPVIRRSNCTSSNNVCNMGSVRCSTVYPEKFSGTGPLWGANSCDDDMCQIDDKDDFIVHQSVKFGSAILSDHLNKSFNPMCEPTDDWPCKFDESPELTKSGANLSSHQTISKPAGSPRASNERENDFTFPCGPLVGDDDDEVTESKIRAFLDEKALDLKKLQTPLYEEFYNSTLNAAGPPSAVGKSHDNVTNFLNLPPKSRSPNRTPTRRLSAAVDAACTSNSANHTKRGLNVGTISDRTLKEIQSPQLSEWKELLLDAQQEPVSLSTNFSERRRKWKEELDQELEKKRELLRQAGVGGKTASPKDQILNRPRERLRFAFPGK